MHELLVPHLEPDTCSQVQAPQWPVRVFHLRPFPSLVSTSIGLIYTGFTDIGFSHHSIPDSGQNIMDVNERSAYPHPGDFKVMRPEYLEQEDGFFVATITITPFKVTGKSSTMAGARRAALYEAEKTYKSYHPSYRVINPYPNEFTDQEGQVWTRNSPMQREKLGDYAFTDADGEEDYADIEQMLMWDVRPVKEAVEG